MTSPVLTVRAFLEFYYVCICENFKIHENSQQRAKIGKRLYYSALSNVMLLHFSQVISLVIFSISPPCFPGLCCCHFGKTVSIVPGTGKVGLLLENLENRLSNIGKILESFIIYLGEKSALVYNSFNNLSLYYDGSLLEYNAL